jgi:hypothetical protein
MPEMPIYLGSRKSELSEANTIKIPHMLNPSRKFEIASSTEPPNAPVKRMANLLPIKEPVVKEKLVDDSSSRQAKVDTVISLSDINQRTIKTCNQDFAARQDNQPSQQFYISPARELKSQTVLVEGHEPKPPLELRPKSLLTLVRNARNQSANQRTTQFQVQRRLRGKSARNTKGEDQQPS